MIVGVAVASFAITFGLGVGRQNYAAIPLPDPVAAPSMQIQPPTHSPPRIAETAPPIVPKVAPAGTDSGPELPLQVLFRRPIKSDQLIGRVINSATEPLALVVNIVGASTHRILSIRLNVPANGQASFGSDDNIFLEHGDQVTLQSPPYRDLVALVP